MELRISSKENKEVIDITKQVDEQLVQNKVEAGIAIIFVKHTTAALTVSEVGEGTEEDLLEAVQEVIPQLQFRHAHHPSHAPDHMIGSIVGPSISIPVINGKLDLGTWQRVILLELNGPRELQLTLSF
jgi:secondary thiamine-phosphate synthase enzyme